MSLRCDVAPKRPDPVIACGKREAFAQGSPCDEAIQVSHEALWIASLAIVQRRERSLAPRPQFQAFQPGSNADADLPLHAQWLQRDRIGGSAAQHVAADADAER